MFRIINILMFKINMVSDIYISSWGGCHSWPLLRSSQSAISAKSWPCSSIWKGLKRPLLSSSLPSPFSAPSNGHKSKRLPPPVKSFSKASQPLQNHQPRHSSLFLQIPPAIIPWVFFELTVPNSPSQSCMSHQQNHSGKPTWLAWQDGLNLLTSSSMEVLLFLIHARRCFGQLEPTATGFCS